MSFFVSTILFALLLTACVPRSKSSGPLNAAKESFADSEVKFPAEAPTNFRDMPAWFLSPAKISAKPDQETVWAISQCRCAAETTVDLLKGYAKTEGVLTQFLVPRVRETIRANSTLKVLLNLPGALKEALRKLFANDQALAKQVRENLSKKIAKATGTMLHEDIDFRFDHYLLNGESGDAFKVQDMVSRWNLVFSLTGFWQKGKPLAFDNHGLQVLETARTLSEWKYFFALDKDSKGGYYGGLSFDTTDPKSTKLVRFDPRDEPEARRTISGTYSLKVPDDITAVDLVTNTKESWTREAEAPTILEQSMMWNAGAQAFTRLRMDRRSRHADGLYGTTDDFLLPVESHKLPLIFMKGLQSQLQDVFLDKDLRVVGNKALPGEKIDLRLLARLGRSLFSWVSVLTDLDKAGLEPDQLEKLKDAPDKLKDGLRLVILNILRDRKLMDTSNESIADISEALSLIVDAEQGALPSPHLQDEALVAFRHLLLQRFIPAWQGKAELKPTTPDLIWFYTLASAVNKYPVEKHKIPWLKDLVASLETSLGEREDFPWK